MINITTDRKLEIFERFDTDNTLFKHKKRPVPKEGQKYVVPPDYIDQDFDIVNPYDEGSKKAPFFSQQTNWLMNSPIPSPKPISYLKRLLQWFKRKPKQLTQLTPAETYRIVFRNMEQLKQFTVKQNAFEEMIQNAKQNGQISLFEELAHKRQITIYEDALLVLGYSSFVTESMIVELAERSDKAFRLDWIKNFARIIPNHAAERKKKLDESMIFDNYVVLHYDPDGKGNKLTQAEIQSKRDPILFGLIKNSRRLYFVADWVDTTCTLTFEELLKHFEQDKVQADPTTTTLA